MVPKVLKPASSARRAHSTSVLPSVSGIVVGRPIPTSTMTPLLDPRVDLARPVNHRTKLGYRYGLCHNSSDPSLSSGELGGYSEDGPRDNHGHQRSTAVNPNSRQDQRRRRDQHGLTTRSLDGMQRVRAAGPWLPWRVGRLRRRLGHARLASPWGVPYVAQRRPATSTAP